MTAAHQSIHRVIDPRTGESISMRELAERYDLPYDCVTRRNREGKTGHELVKPPAACRQVAGAKGHLARARVLSGPTRREIAREVLATPEGQLAARPFTRMGRKSA